MNATPPDPSSPPPGPGPADAPDAPSPADRLADLRRSAMMIDARHLTPLIAHAGRPEAGRAEQESWIAVAVESNGAIDAYLRSLDPDLPEHYGMPVDGIRRVVEPLRRERDDLLSRASEADGYADHHSREAGEPAAERDRLAAENAALRAQAEAGRELARASLRAWRDARPTDVGPGPPAVVPAVAAIEAMRRLALGLILRPVAGRGGAPAGEGPPR